MWVNTRGGSPSTSITEPVLVETVDAQLAAAGQVVVAEDEVLGRAAPGTDAFPGVFANGVSHGHVADEDQCIAVEPTVASHSQ